MTFEDERRAIQDALPEAVSIYGSQDLDLREQAIVDFSDGKFKYLSAKPVIAGSGCNFQRFCHKAIFVGIGFKFNDFIQAVHRIQRFLQAHPVEIHIIHSEAERDVLRTLMDKWQRHKDMVNNMTEVIKQHGLNSLSMNDVLARTIGVERIEVSGKDYRVANNDCVLEAMSMETNSVDLIITSIPSANHYEYTPSYNDFGHTEKQRSFLATDGLSHAGTVARMLKPGRMYCCHVKDRILFGNVTGAAAPTVSPFHAEALFHAKTRLRLHGHDYRFTDVVRENNQTYRLGWSGSKDGSRWAGSPEYILLLRKPQTDRSKGYADEPVKKSKDEYTRAQWQVDAHGSGVAAATGKSQPKNWPLARQSWRRPLPITAWPMLRL